MTSPMTAQQLAALARMAPLAHNAAVLDGARTARLAMMFSPRAHHPSGRAERGATWIRARLDVLDEQARQSERT